MSWLGIGLISRSFMPIGELNEAFDPPAVITPSAQWNGTMTSGFTSLPEDPVRTTAKPACRLIVPPNQHFTNTLDVGVIAMANDDGSLMRNFGIKQVKFNYEGREQVVSAPRWHTIVTERGLRTYFGWWIKLVKPIGDEGAAQLYIEAEPYDATMQKRVIGPYNFCPVDQLYDLDLEVNPDLSEIAGQRYQTILDAATYARAEAAQNPRFFITKAGKYQVTPDGSAGLAPAAWDITGRYTIEASVPGVSIGRLEYTSDSDAVIPAMQAYWRLKGSNITFDTFHVRYWSGRDNNNFPNDAGHWFDGITVTTTSPDGKDDMMRGGSYLRSADIIQNWGWLTEVNFIDQNTPATKNALVRGCYFLNSSQDLITSTLCCVQSTFEHSDQDFWNSDALAFSVTVPAGDTLERAGGNNGSGAGGGVWTATVNGDVFTFDVGNGAEAYFLGTADYNGASGIGGYWVSDVVDWLNSLPGWSAALSPEFAARDRRASFLSRPGRKGRGFTLALGNAIEGDGTTAFDIVWCVDTHGDWYQHTSGILENCIIAFNRVWDCQVQLIFLAPIKRSGVAGTLDTFLVGNLLAIDQAEKLYYNPNANASQISRPQDVSHLVIAHNTIANQRFQANFNETGAQDIGYNLIKNNTFRTFEWNANFIPANIVVDGLLIHGDQTIPANVTNYLALGEAETLYANPFNGDFAPTPLLRQKGFAPAIPVDQNQTEFPDPCAPGGFAATANELLFIPPAPNPGDVLGEAGMALAEAIVERVHGGMWLFTTANNSGIWSAANLSGNGSDFTQGNASFQPSIDPALGAIFDENDQINASLFAGDYTVFILLKKDLVSTNGHIIPNQIIHSSNSTARAAAQAGAQVFIDDVLSATRGTTFTALDQRIDGDTSYRIVRVEGLNLATLSLGRASGGAFAGTIRAIVAIPEFDMEDEGSEAPSLNEVRALADVWLTEQKDLLAS